MKSVCEKLAPEESGQLHASHAPKAAQQFQQFQAHLNRFSVLLVLKEDKISASSGGSEEVVLLFFFIVKQSYLHIPNAFN